MRLNRMIPIAVVMVAFSLPVTAAPTTNLHDGTWRVKTSAEDGRCKDNYDFNVAVKNGRVTYAGIWPVKASGAVEPGGVIAMDLAHAGKNVVARGLVRGDSASGEWSSAKLDCSGSWVASKQS